MLLSLNNKTVQNSYIDTYNQKAYENGWIKNLSKSHERQGKLDFKFMTASVSAR